MKKSIIQLGLILLLVNNIFARENGYHMAQECIDRYNQGRYFNKVKCRDLGMEFITGTGRVRIDIGLGRKLIKNSCDAGDSGACFLLNSEIAVKAFFNFFK